MMYESGVGVEKSAAEAAAWFGNAAEQGHPQSEYNLGKYYLEGIGVEQDYDDAAKWLRLAALHGIEKAKEDLVDLRIYVQGFERNAEALREKAEKGDRDSQFRYGRLFYRGQGVKRDLREAAKWFEQAATRELPEAQYRLAAMYETGSGLDQNMVKAAEWYQKAADQGLSRAEYALGGFYAGGLGGFERDFKKAAIWYQKAAIKGNTSAQYDLGALYYNGNGVEKNYPEAYFWFAVAIKAGYGGYTMSLPVLGNRMPAAQLRAVKQRVIEFRPQLGAEDETFMK